MEFSREIYWNVGGGASTLVPMYLLVIAAFALFTNEALQRIAAYRQGKPLNRFDNLPMRIVAMVKSMLLQTRVLNVRLPGLAHAFFFWGFSVLFVGTLLILVQTDFTNLLFDVKFLKGNFYLFFSLALDVAGLVVIVMLSGLLLRRFLIRPEGLETNIDDIYVHLLLFAILITGFLVEGARIAMTEMGTELAYWSPVGLTFAKVTSALGEDSLRSLHLYTWWGHLSLVAIFIGSIPFTKLRHIITTPANQLFADYGPKGMLPNLDLEDESTRCFGASKVTELTWKDIFDADACTQCKRCQDLCPAHITDKPLSPMKIINVIGEAAFNRPDVDLIEGCNKDALWSCTTCLACQEICPASIEHTNKIISMRRNMVLMEGQFSGEEVSAAMQQTEINGNLFGFAFARRGEWAGGLGVKNISEDSEVDILYFVGCYASFDERNVKVAKAFVKLCHAAGIKIGILGKEEVCCGEPIRKAGNEYLYQSLAKQNVRRIEMSGINKVVTSCPHCFNTLDKDYRELGFDLEVEHYTTFLEGLLANGKLNLEASRFDCTYHDSCYLGRHNNIYEAPRRLIESMGGHLAEMQRSLSKSFCCSAGGGRIMAEENLGERINRKRIDMAAETGMSALLSSCPFCLAMFEDGIKGANIEDKLVAKDITELMAERLL